MREDVRELWKAVNRVGFEIISIKKGGWC